MSTLKRALEIAREAHAGQVDKAGRPYIEHVLRVVAAVEGEDAKVVAALHDVLEDCPEWNISRLRTEGFGHYELFAIRSLTRWPGESYNEFIRAIRRDKLATVVKLADLRDNADPARLALLPEATRDRLSRKYAAALARLGSGADQPSP